MAKGTLAQAVPGRSKRYDEWEVRDAMHTMMRAGELTKDKKLMGLVRKEAAKHAQEMREVSHKAAMLAKSGHISPKAMAKHITKNKGNDGGNVRALEKTAAIA